MKEVHGFADGTRVHHRRWGHTGTVRIIDDPQPGEAVAEVQWDGSIVADDLDLVLDDLDPLP